ncbi:MAG: TonB-dependent receptor [Chitinophagales bacterium]|nr:TonB-dependent receptor [Chitinophagales bacterium]
MKYILIPAIIFTTTLLMGQADTAYLDIKQVEVLKDFEAKIQDASLHQVKPATPPATNFTPSYKYTISQFPVQTEAARPQILPLALPQDAPFIVNNGYLFAAYGIKNNIDVSAGYHLAQKDRYNAGIQIGYQSLDNSKNTPYQQYNQTKIGLFGDYLLKENLKLYGQINTSFQNRYLYHTDLGIDTLYESQDLRRKLNANKITIGIANPESTKYNFNYDVKFNIHNLSIDAKKARDNGFGIEAMGEKLFGKSSVIYAHAGYNYTSYRDSLDASLSIAYFTPHFKTKISNLLLDGGVQMLYTSDGRSSLFPEAELGWFVPEQNLLIFAKVQQQYFTNTAMNISTFNPYINTSIDSLTTSVWQEYSAGLKGKFSFLGYQAKVGYKNIKNQMFLLNHEEDLRVFDMVYDHLGTTFISGNLDFTFSNTFQFGGWLTQNFLKTDTLAQAWHTPALEANVYTVIHLLDDKLSFRGDVFLGSAVHYIDKLGTEASSGFLLDLSIEADYALFERFHLNLKGMNLFNNQYERYYGYPNVGTQLRGGIKWVF